jgi:hypothetical protein
MEQTRYVYTWFSVILFIMVDFAVGLIKTIVVYFNDFLILEK